MGLEKFRPHERITDPAVFRQAFERKRSVSDAFVIVYGIENGLDYCRLGISASKRRIRKASDRNRVKRVLREAFRTSKQLLPPGVDLIVVPRGPGLAYVNARDSISELSRSVARRLGIRVAKAITSSGDG